MPYTNAMRMNIKETLQRTGFDDERLRDLATDPAMTVEQVLDRARKVVQSNESSARDVEQAAVIIKMIQGFSTT